MEPETAKSLMESGPGQALGKYLAEQIAELDNLSDITGDLAFPIALEVKARQHARRKLVDILRGLLRYTENGIITKKANEYEVG